MFFLQFQKTGKWNAMHVRIAWEIYNHQQKAKAESRLPTTTTTSSSLHHKTGLELMGKAPLPPGADYLNKRSDLLYGGPVGRMAAAPPPTNPFDPLGAARSPYAAAAARGFYGPSPLGK